VFELRPSTLLKLLEGLDALRRPERFAQFLLACEADARGRTGFAERAYPQADYLREALAAARGAAVQPLLERGLRGEALGQGLARERQAALAALKQDWATSSPA